MPVTKSALVLEKARQLNILLVYLPPYSPNLNLIERLWKFVKKGSSPKCVGEFQGCVYRIDDQGGGRERDRWGGIPPPRSPGTALGLLASRALFSAQVERDYIVGK